jgi:hypothetical protein
LVVGLPEEEPMLLWIAALSVAHADQCSWVTKANADAALEHLAEGSEWLSYCEPCGDAAPDHRTVGAATAAPVDDRFWQVSVDGKPIDLAYTFVRASADDPFFSNLARLVDCEASMVSRKVTWPPTTQQSDRLASWIGTYSGPKTRLKITQFFDDPNGLAIQLDHPTEHDSGAAELEIVSYVDIDGDPLSFATALGTCRVVLARARGGVTLTPQASCAGLLDAIAGTYSRIE